MKISNWLVLSFAMLGALGAARADSVAPEHGAVAKAVAVLSPTQGHAVRGVVTFTQVSGGVRVVADVTGLTPGDHGFHVHEFGDCSAPDAASAGGHFNPHHGPHAAPDAATRHAGDLGNLTADANGKAHYDRVDSQLSLTGHDTIVGHGLIVHEKVDDLRTQPTGNAGGRVACGVIGVAK